MKGHIARFSSRAALLKQEQAAELRQMVLPWEADAPGAVRQLLSLIDRNTAASKGWTFIMLSPAQNYAVNVWILDHAKRPRVSSRLWSAMFCHLRMDTGEVVMTRKQMMEESGAASPHVSEALSELAALGALIRHQEGREVRWFMNATIGTCLTGVAREKAQAAAPRLRVVPAA
jgi:hypothetical protein